MEDPSRLARLHTSEETRRGRIGPVSERRFHLARYRSRVAFRHRWKGSVAVVAMIGLIGGLGLGSLAAARRTQSSFSALLASSNASELTVTMYGSGASGGNLAYSPSLTRRIARVPGVRHVAPGFVAVGAPLAPDGAPRIRIAGLAYPVASVNGLFFTQDRMAVSEGRLADPRRPDEIVMAPVVAKLARIPRRSGHPVRVLLECAAIVAELRVQGGAAGVANQSETRRSRVHELGDRRGRRRHPSDLHPTDTCVHTEGAGGGQPVRRADLRHHDVGRAQHRSRGRARNSPSHPARPDSH